MRTSLKIFSLLIFLIFACLKDDLNEPIHEKPQTIITLPKGSLINEDHTSEGFLISLEDGIIVHFFRLDPGENGSHIGNKGRIVKRVSLDDGNTWSSHSIVYEDDFDDRNVHGGITDDNLIVFFLEDMMQIIINQST